MSSQQRVVCCNAGRTVSVTPALHVPAKRQHHHRHLCMAATTTAFTGRTQCHQHNVTDQAMAMVPPAPPPAVHIRRAAHACFNVVLTHWVVAPLNRLCSSSPCTAQAHHDACAYVHHATWMLLVSWALACIPVHFNDAFSVFTTLRRSAAHGGVHAHDKVYSGAKGLRRAVEDRALPVHSIYANSLLT